MPIDRRVRRVASGFRFDDDLKVFIVSSFECAIAEATAGALTS